MQLEFSEFGDLLKLTACFPLCGEPAASVQEFNSYRGFISVNRDSDGLFIFERIDGDHSIQVEFKNLVSGEYRRWRIPHRGYLLGLELSRPQALSMASGETFMARTTSGFTAWLEQLRYVVSDEGQFIQSGIGDATPGRQIEARWTGFRNRYWAALVRPGQQVLAEVRNAGEYEEVQIDLYPLSAGEIRFTIYAGPLELDSLKSANPELRTLLYAGSWRWLRWLSEKMQWALNLIFSVVKNWGLSIVLLAFMVQLVLWPLHRRMAKIRDQVRLQDARLAPRLKDSRGRFKGDQQSEAISALFDHEGIHPLYRLKPVLGMLILVPVFISAFTMLAASIRLKDEPFLWIGDLSMPDALYHLPVALPFLGAELNLLPMLLVMLTLPVSWLHSRKTTAGTSATSWWKKPALVAVFFLLLFYTFPSGMVLFWMVNNFMVLMIAALQDRAEPA